MGIASTPKPKTQNPHLSKGPISMKITIDVVFQKELTLNSLVNKTHVLVTFLLRKGIY